ncbi:hypothetical protein SHIRM173S_05047 [Streptomyces hirsutus]
MPGRDPEQPLFFTVRVTTGDGTVGASPFAALTGGIHGPTEYQLRYTLMRRPVGDGGTGLDDLFPVAIERAGALADPSGVATASTLGYGGMLLGPPAIGFMADRFSLPAALTSVAVLAAVATVIGFATRKAAPA